MNVHAIKDVLEQGVMLDAVVQSISDGLSSPVERPLHLESGR